MIAPLKPTNTELPDMVLEHPGIHVLTEEYHDCICGIDSDCERVIYDLEKMLEVIMAGDETLSRDDAYEHFTFNIKDCMPKEVSPVYIFPVTSE